MSIEQTNNQEPRKFIIDRSKWRFGGIKFEEHFGITSLKNNKGYFCCLGFISIQAGVPEDLLLDIAGPGSLPYNANSTTEKHPLEGFLVEKKSYKIREKDEPRHTFISRDITQTAITINDDKNLTLEEREKELTELFATINIQLEFEGEYTSEQLKAVKYNVNSDTSQ